MISIDELKWEVDKSHMDIATLEKDYIVGWILKSTYEDDLLGRILILKEALP